MPAASAPDPAPLVYCPVCKQRTRSLKYYEIPALLESAPIALHRQRMMTACPPCMREELWRQAIRAIGEVALAAPFVWLHLLVLAAWTHVPGHSNRLVALAHESLEEPRYVPEPARRRAAPEARGFVAPSWRQCLFLAVVFLLIVAPMAWLLLQPGEQRPPAQSEQSEVGKINVAELLRDWRMEKANRAALRVVELTAELKEGQPAKRIAAAAQLSHLGVDAIGAVPALQAAAEDGNDAVAFAAIDALLRIDPEAAQSFQLGLPRAR